MKAQQIEFALQLPGERLDKALTTTHPEISRMQWQFLIKEGRVLVNGKTAKPSQRLDGGEQIQADIPEAIESDLKAELIPLDIRYEDEDLLVVNKPAGMVVHPGTGHDSGTLVNALLAYCPDLSGIGNTKRPGIVHRLDKNTSGVMVVAKNDRAQHYLQYQFKERTIGKKYLGLVHGHIQPTAALIDAPIGRNPRYRKKMSVIEPGSARFKSSRSRPAQTRYQMLAVYEDYSLVECAPLTGRTHQIRVHLAYIGYPIAGDKVYGHRKQKFALDRHFLHAAELTFKRPSDNLELSIKAELSLELQDLIKKLSGQ